jgi:hypothetical protein
MIVFKNYLFTSLAIVSINVFGFVFAINVRAYRAVLQVSAIGLRGKFNEDLKNHVQDFNLNFPSIITKTIPLHKK